MAFQTFSTRRTDLRDQRGFTLVEMMISASLGTLILAGVLSTFLLMGRTAANVVNYTDIEAKARMALELFSREVHNANNVTSYSASGVTLTIPDTASSDPDGTGAGSYTVTYAFDSANKKLTRSGPPIDDPSVPPPYTPTDLITGVSLVPGTSAYLNYYRYVRPTTYPLGEGYFDGFTTNTAANALEIKQIEVSFVLERKNVTVSAATNKVLSARFILRNK